jgi:hypothetical protein
VFTRRYHKTNSTNAGARMIPVLNQCRNFTRERIRGSM